MAREEYLTIRGLRHRLLRWGPSTDSPIVLLHGHMDTSETWQFMIEHLPRDWSFAAFDWRGFGGTDRVPGGYWFPDYYADLEAMLGQLVPAGRARLIAHSMGGLIAMIYAGVRPERIEWIVNLEGIGVPPAHPEQAPGRYAEWLNAVGRELRGARWPSVDSFALQLRAKNPRWTTAQAAFIARAWTRPCAGGDGVELAADPRHRWPNPLLHRFEEVAACWRAVRAPLLLLLAEDSEHRSGYERAGGAEPLKSAIRDFQLAWVSNAGHMMHIDNPAAVAAQIERFGRAHASATRCGLS